MVPVLFKYRADNEYTERVFSRRMVWLSTASELNDPFECSIQELAAEWINEKVNVAKTAQFHALYSQVVSAVERGADYFAMPKNHLVKMLESIRAEKTFDVAHRSLVNLHTLASGMTMSNPERLFADLDAQLSSVGIFSMSECPDNSLMWAHYGGNHAGICLGFRVTPDSMLANSQHCLPVMYSAELPRMSADGLQTDLSVSAGGNGELVSRMRVSFSDPTFQAAMTTKAECWTYEREWRYVEEVGGEYAWPGQLAEITFGLRCPESRREHYIRLAEEYCSGDIELFAMQKVPNSNALVRQTVGTVTGQASGQSTTTAEPSSIRVASSRVIANHIEALLRGGDFKDALEILDSLLEKDPNFGPALYQKGIALGYMGDHGSALRLFEACCAEIPEDGTVWYQKGVALSQLGRDLEAIEAYRAAHAREPLDASTALNLGVTLVRTGCIEEGRHWLEAAAKNGHPRALQLLEDLATSEPRSRNQDAGAGPARTPRNAACPCGSGRKFKKCHGK